MKVKRIFFYGVLTAFFLGVILTGSGKAEAADMWSKLGRGFNNILFCPLEVCYRPYEMHENGESWAVAGAGGVVKGLGYTVARLGVGVFEVLTFPHPAPNNYEPILLPEHMILSN